jgi:hypothetical protein
MIRFFRSLVWGGRLAAALSRAEKMRAAGKRQAAFSVVQKAIIGLDKAGLAEEAPLDLARAILVAIGEALAYELEEPGFPEAELAKALALIASVNTEAEQEGYALYIPFLRSRIHRLRGNQGSDPMG